LLIGGTALVALFSDPMVDAVASFSTATHIPPFFVSFLVIHGPSTLDSCTKTPKNIPRLLAFSSVTHQHPGMCIDPKNLKISLQNPQSEPSNSLPFLCSPPNKGHSVCVKRQRTRQLPAVCQEEEDKEHLLDVQPGVRGDYNEQHNVSRPLSPRGLVPQTRLDLFIRSRRHAQSPLFPLQRRHIFVDTVCQPPLERPNRLIFEPPGPYVSSYLSLVDHT